MTHDPESTSTTPVLITATLTVGSTDTTFSDKLTFPDDSTSDKPNLLHKHNHADEKEKLRHCKIRKKS